MFQLKVRSYDICPSPPGLEFYAAERKKEFIPFATAWMELESIMLSEISILLFIQKGYSSTKYMPS